MAGAFAFILFSVSILVLTDPAQAQSRASIAEAVAAAEEVDALRRSLTPAVLSQDKITEETFAQVCKPVGARAKQIAADKGWTFLQMAEKNRNPAHRADEGAREAMKRFRDDPRLQGFWIQTSLNEKSGFRYFRRITVEKACLACHGDKGKRPDFIVKKYPEDLAHGFKEGDLRGVYSTM